MQKSQAEGYSSMRHRFIATSAIILILSLLANAQSGRGRGTPPATPQPKQPTPAPNVPKTVLGAPDGGKLLRADIDGATTRYIMKNGIHVLIRERHAAPLLAVHVSVRAGTLSETDEQAGMAQLVQRMILRGTAKRPAGTIEKEAARLGGVLKASSDYDHTEFTLVAPAESLTGMLELLSDLLLNPAFDPNELKLVAGAMLQESKRQTERLDAYGLDRMFATAFTTHRLKRGRSVNETMLANVTREQVVNFWQQHYQPQYVLVTLVGDVFSLNAVGQVQLTFGHLTKAAAPTPTPAPKSAPASAPARGKAAPAPTLAPTPTPAPQNPFEEAPQDKLRYSNTRGDISQTLVTIGYRVPTLDKSKDSLKEQAILEVLAAALGLGRGSRLAQMLPERSGLPTESGASYYTLPNVGMFAVQLRVEPGRIDRVEADYFRELEKFKRELLGEGELQRAKSMLEKQYFDSLSSQLDEAALLSNYYALLGDYRALDTFVERTRAVTAEEVQQAAAKYLALTNTSVHEYEPATAQARTFTPEKFAELVVTFAPTAAQPVKPEEVKPAVALKTFKQGEERGGVLEGRNILIAEAPLPIKDFSVLRGPRAYVREDKSLPKLTVGVFFQGGRLLEDQTTNGTTELMLRAMLRSTTSKKGDLIALELESYGGEIQIVNEPDLFGYTLDVLSRNAEPAVRLLLDIMENPYFDKPELTRERDALLADQLKQRDNARARAVELLWASLYPGGHPYGLPRLGTPEVIKAVTEEKLEAWHVKLTKRQFPLVVIVGDTDGSSLVSRIFSEGFKRGDLDKAIKANLPPLTQPPTEQVEQRARPQTALAVGFRTSDKDAADYLVMRMWGALLSSGRFTDELRSKHGITDAAVVQPDLRLASGAFYAVLTTEPGKEQPAFETLRDGFAQLLANPPNDEEFERGRNATIGAYAINLQSHQRRALEYARTILVGRKPSDVENQPDLLRAIKRSDFKRVAESIVKPTQIGRGVVRGQ
jgi:zinc protease